MPCTHYGIVITITVAALFVGSWFGGKFVWISRPKASFEWKTLVEYGYTITLYLVVPIGGLIWGLRWLDPLCK